MLVPAKVACRTPLLHTWIIAATRQHLSLGREMNGCSENGTPDFDSGKSTITNCLINVSGSSLILLLGRPKLNLPKGDLPSCSVPCSMRGRSPKGPLGDPPQTRSWDPEPVGPKATSHPRVGRAQDSAPTRRNGDGRKKGRMKE